MTNDQQPNHDQEQSSGGDAADAAEAANPSANPNSQSGNASDSAQPHSTDEVFAEGDFSGEGDATSSGGASGEAEWEQLRQQLADAQNHALRTQAELDNFRKRVYRDMEVERRYAEENLLRDLLQVMDNMSRAIQAASEAAGENSTILQGMQMVQQQFMSVLEAHHCRRIEAREQPFDPNFHEAISQIPHDTVPEGQVVDVAVEGYVLHERVLRPSQVLVSAGAPS